MVDEDTNKGTDDPNPEGQGNGTSGQPQGDQQGSDAAGQTGVGQEGSDAGDTGAEPAPQSLDFLTNPEAQQAIRQAALGIIAEREAQQQATEERKALRQKPDDELGRQVKEDLARQEQMDALLPEVRLGYYQNTVAELVKGVPELAALTPEERATLLSPNLRSDAEVLKVLCETIANKRVGTQLNAAVEAEIQKRAQAQQQDAVVQGNQQQAPGLGSGAPVGTAGDKTHHDDLLSDHFKETPPPA